jgi:alkanesulfonate monooxygenase SsuD/methylene tetrahydromethanopterin reductase-like flavin-dependent oxidoreductase (luciferase family)
LKFGIDHLFTWRGQHTQAQVLRDALAQTVLAEQLGFDSCWIAEHHFSSYGIVGGLLTMAAALAQVTHRIRIGLAVSVLPLNHPIRIAEDVALVDILSNGRLDVGVGRGYQPTEFAKFGIPFEEARERFDESLEILKLAWTQERFDFKGRFWQMEDVSIFPKPIQKPYPPLLYAAVSTSTFDRVGREGQRILTSPNFTSIDLVKACFDTYRGALRENNHDPADFDYPLLQQVYVHEDEKSAREDARDYTMWYYSLLGNLLPSEQRGAVPDQYRQYAKIQRNVQDLTYDYLLEHGVNFGTPEQVTQKIRRLQEEVGVNHYIGWFNVGGLPHDKVVRSMRLFAEQVMPAFAEPGQDGRNSALFAAAGE